MIVLGAIILMGIALGVVIYPLLRPMAQEIPVEDSPLDELLSKKESTYSAIKEIEFEHALGNLTTADLGEIEGKYKDKAVAILREIDDRQHQGRTRDELERQIAARRAAKRSGKADDDVERQILQRRQAGKPPVASTSTSTSCPNCGNRIQPQAKFCPKCGRSMAAKCPQCGAGQKTGDVFCSQCGANLRKG